MTRKKLIDRKYFQKEEEEYRKSQNNKYLNLYNF